MRLDGTEENGQVAQELKRKAYVRHEPGRFI